MVQYRHRIKTWTNGGPGLAAWEYSPAQNRARSPRSSWQKTSDVVGNPKQDNPFMSERFTIESFTRINGSRTSFGYPVKWENAVPECVYIGTHAAAKRVPGHYMSVAEGVQAANPSNPLIAVPTFLFELKDVPRMLKHAGRLAKRLSERAGNPPISRIASYLDSPRAVAEDFLAYKFGWEPFISDLLAVSGIADDVAKRHRMLSKASARGYISRRSQLGSNHTQSTNSRYPFDSFMGDWYGQATDVYTTQRWCVSKWLVDPYSYSGSLRENRLKLLRQTLGLDVSFQNVWNVVPWSWLFDWFSDAAIMIQVNSNRHGIRYSSSCTMEHNVAIRTIDPYPRFGVTSGPAVFKHETKSRAVGFPLPFQGGLNYFSPSQLGILAALKVSRGSRASYF